MPAAIVGVVVLLVEEPGVDVEFGGDSVELLLILFGRNCGLLVGIGFWFCLAA